MSEPVSSGKVALPPGVKVGAGRETSSVNGQGAVVQGMAFPITLPGGSTTTVFVPYDEIHDTARVQAIVADRVRAIMAISG